jgi:hypothetical protein
MTTVGAGRIEGLVGGKIKMRRGVLATKDAERFLSAQADPFAGAKGEEKVGLLRSG